MRQGLAAQAAAMAITLATVVTTGCWTHPVWAAGPAASTVRHIQWAELVPKGWDPYKDSRMKFKDLNLGMLQDSDPKVMEMMNQMREVWDTAPVNDNMQGVVGRLPGYIVPLEESAKGLKEFLLVPYYGACIHSPPPPANQIVHVRLKQPIKGYKSMDTVWVYGAIQVQRDPSYMGNSGYRIDATAVERYVAPPAQVASTPSKP
ncbi:MAG: DUF3299 domain-containing protein [Burkholderiales bacterium]|nr:DUF3299 domain-containing protein [Burkholderiales bacterium]